VVSLDVKVAHAHLSKVTRVVLVNVCAVVVLTTGHTTTTGVLAVLSDTTVTGRDMAAARVVVSMRKRWALVERLTVFWSCSGG
jgi:hypothetical protein